MIHAQLSCLNIRELLYCFVWDDMDAFGEIRSKAIHCTALDFELRRMLLSYFVLVTSLRDNLWKRTIESWLTTLMVS